MNWIVLFSFWDFSKLILIEGDEKYMFYFSSMKADSALQQLLPIHRAVVFHSVLYLLSCEIF